MLKKISIRSQLLIAAILLSVLLVAVGTSGLWGMSQTNDRVRHLRKPDRPGDTVGRPQGEDTAHAHGHRDRDRL